jgi:hypothetical protein
MSKKQPLQDSFETIEETIRQTARQAVKSAGDTVTAAATDAKQQLTGDYPASPDAALGGSGQQQKALTHQQQQIITSQNRQILDQTRQNIERINSDIMKVRQEKENLQRQTTRENQKKKQKQTVEEKKKEEPVWKKMLQGKRGTHEISQRAAG